VVRLAIGLACRAFSFPDEQVLVATRVTGGQATVKYVGIPEQESMPYDDDSALLSMELGAIN
jgi:hypothetical protein